MSPGVSVDSSASHPYPAAMAKLIVIPARLASQRLPGKLLLDETGWPLIRHVHERCLQVPDVDGVVVATDGNTLAEAVVKFGGEVVLTPEDLPTGTDRVAHACQQLGLSPTDLVVNVQGDEPEMDPQHVEFLFRLLEEHPDSSVATLAVKRSGEQSEADFRNRNRVKVIADESGRALGFTRSPVPADVEIGVPEGGWLQLFGIYGFRSAALMQFPGLPRGDLEQRERLEQLRLLEAGCEIRVGLVDSAASGIDIEADYRRFVEKNRKARKGQSGPRESGKIPVDQPDRGGTDDKS